MVLTWEQVAAAAYRAGFRGDDLAVATAIAQPESGRNTRARLVNAREDSRGLWQINTRAHPWSQALDLYDPDINAAAAMRVFTEGKAIHGPTRGFNPWTAYTARSYLVHVPRARQAAAIIEATGTPGPGLGDVLGGSVLGVITGTNPLDLVTDPLDAVARFLRTITSGAFWLRAAQIVGGALLAVVGILLITRDATEALT